MQVSKRIIAGAVLAGLSAVSQAAPAGSMACTGGPGNVTFNVSFFDLGITSPATTGTGSGGAAGKVTLQPLVIHAALGTFPSLFEVGVTGGHFTTCTLTTQASNGEQIKFLLKPVAVDSVKAIASSAGGHALRFAFTEVQMEYGSVEVVTSGGIDDGGSGPAPPVDTLPSAG